MNLFFNTGNIGRCGVRMVETKNLEFHRTQCHDPNPKKGAIYICPECKVPHNIWGKLAMHLWRHHSIDMELLTCQQ